jgi:metallo-beta-lactamase family protein
MPMQLTFLGAAGTVTGSRFLLSGTDGSYLIDCGLFQGGRRLEEKNWQPFAPAPDGLEAVFLTHAHIDHVGYLPRLVAQGFHGPVLATESTCALLELVLPDSARLQEQDAAYANKRGFSRHRPALPLYTMTDAEQVLKLLRPVAFHEFVQLDGLEVAWRPAGHLLGSAILEIEARVGNARRRLVFSGDLGRYNSEMMKPPTSLEHADLLLVESTYGNRRHADELMADGLSGMLKHVAETKGVLLIPAFAVGRTQQVLYHIRKVQEAGLAPNLPVYIDSPMAVDASHIYCRFGDDHNLDVNLLMDGDGCPLRCRETHFVREVKDSKALNSMPGPAVILSASGMLSGGRILHHLKWRLPDARNAVLFVGYQAEGTRGRSLLEGVKRLRIHGEQVPVRSRIASIDALSGHADQDELVRWLGGFANPPRQTFLVHGEPSASLGLDGRIRGELGWETEIAKEGLVVPLG